MAIGFRVFLKRDLPPRELVERFRNLPTPCIADCMSRNCALSSEIRLMTKPSRPMAGVALTVKARDGDNLVLSKAFNMARDGDVIIASNESGRNRSPAGANMMFYARAHGAEGVVLDGPIRDIEDLEGMDWPIYATGTTPGGPYKDGPGEINVPIACGGVVVTPGDIIIGDRDGVLAIPARDAAGVIEAAEEFARADAAKLPMAQNGTLNRSWVDKALEQKSCEILDRRYYDA